MVTFFARLVKLEVLPTALADAADKTSLFKVLLLTADDLKFLFVTFFFRPDAEALALAGASVPDVRFSNKTLVDKALRKTAFLVTFVTLDNFGNDAFTVEDFNALLPLAVAALAVATLDAVGLGGGVTRADLAGFRLPTREPLPLTTEFFTDLEGWTFGDWTFGDVTLVFTFGREAAWLLDEAFDAGFFAVVIINFPKKEASIKDRPKKGNNLDET